MSNLVRQNSADDSNIVVSVIHQILRISGVVLPLKTVNNLVGGFLISANNQSAQYLARQIDIRNIKEEFDRLLLVAIKIRDPRAGAACAFCRRIDGVSDVNYATDFKRNVISAYYSDPNNFLELFSGLENRIVCNFFNNFSNYTLNNSKPR
jgi:hypothetical protein